MSDRNYFDLLDSSVHNPNGLEAILGKFRVPGTASYIDVAEGRIPPATRTTTTAAAIGASASPSVRMRGCRRCSDGS